MMNQDFRELKEEKVFMNKVVVRKEYTDYNTKVEKACKSVERSKLSENDAIVKFAKLNHITESNLRKIIQG